MQEHSTIQPRGNESGEYGAVLTWLIFTAKGFIFPCFSPSFYIEAVKKGLLNAIVFFAIFALGITFVPTIKVYVAMRGIGEELRGAYDRGEFPTIVIKDGLAQVDGPQPLIFEDERNLFAIDTTGGMIEIDTRAYSQGLLLTQTEIHYVNEDGYEVIPLTDLHELFGNPIVIDKSQAVTLWRSVSIWVNILTFVGILMWNSLARFAYIALVGLLIWGIVSIIQKGTGFGPILIAGVFAHVPVIYLREILKLVNISFITLYSILLFGIWGMALWVVLRKNDDERTESPSNISSPF